MERAGSLMAAGGRRERKVVVEGDAPRQSYWAPGLDVVQVRVGLLEVVDDVAVVRHLAAQDFMVADDVSLHSIVVHDEIEFFVEV